MGYIIAIIIGLIIISSIIKFLSEIPVPIIIIFILGVIAFLAGGWKTLFIVIAIGISILILVTLIYSAGTSIKQTIENHDKSKKETEIIKQNTQASIEMHENEKALQKELDLNCKLLGYMDSQSWGEKLSNYKSKKYSKSFDEITYNFGKQMEQQNIMQNDDWFQPFLMYIIEHPQGGTVTKMLNEVKSPQLNITHITPDRELLQEKLIKGTKRISRDVPPIFQEQPLKGMNEPLYVPTKYALKLYGSNLNNNQEISKNEEISFDDL